jgi:hypothetical protein
MEEKITIKNVNLPGYSSTVSKIMYETMLQAMWKVIPSVAPGMTQTEIRKAVLSYLPADLYPGGAKAEWWAKAVQLDQEAEGNLVREATKPLRWHRVR